ncbi:hypothetical protein IWQ62_000605 [Dispira parvispora]|uniref:Mob1/phocein n=1 Tax=Dispira parvispora TaxID=1520584 RepID=A0A9W8E4T9_9FUNG|nr:hypothetical protein IWQ62_000605 [Dispira parvispora]
MKSPDDSDSPFGAREYLQAHVAKHPEDIETLVALPKGVSRNVWIYEHMRLACIELNYFVGYLHIECTEESCPEMVLSDWRFLCAAHRPPRSCTALYYIVHTLDQAISILTDVDQFPLLASIPDHSLKVLKDMARRLDRIFMHAYTMHPTTFHKFENHYHTYSRFARLMQSYELVAENHLTHPEFTRRYANS